MTLQQITLEIPENVLLADKTDAASFVSIFDIERSLLTGEIVDRQKDTETSEWKYLVKGQTVASDEIVVVVKISPTGKLVFITTYRL